MADVFDSLTSDRVYRKAMSDGRALEHIVAGHKQTLRADARGSVTGQLRLPYVQCRGNTLTRRSEPTARTTSASAAYGPSSEALTHRRHRQRCVRGSGEDFGPCQQGASSNRKLILGTTTHTNCRDRGPRIFNYCVPSTYVVCQPRS